MSEVAGAEVATPLSVPLRTPDEVMKLARMGAAHPTRLSFLRTLLRRAKAERWRFSRPVWNIGDDGYGHAVYRIDTPDSTLSLVAFSTYLAPQDRTDRVIAQAWDSSYVLYDGMPDAAEIDRLSNAVPRQEAARYSNRELALSRANKSVRLFDHVVDALAQGRQPDQALVDSVGYLMRTTAVYGNGKFGIADRDAVLFHPALQGPYQAEMLSVWLTRSFTLDLVEHCARAKAPAAAVPLAPEMRRRFGVGNATGLGMAPFLVRHPALLHQWVTARETALARVRSITTVEDAQWQGFLDALADAHRLVAVWRTDDPTQATRISALANDLAHLETEARRLSVQSRGALWNRIWLWAAAHLALEAQELTLTLLLEPHGTLIDDLADTMAADEGQAFRIDGTMTCGALLILADEQTRWARELNFGDPATQARFWYVSEEKLEPRLGERAEEPGCDLEMPLATVRDALTLRAALATSPAATLVAAFLLAHPDHRHTVRRIQQAVARPYGEIRDNLISADMRPIDIMRFKLAFFGANRFDPRSDRWVRITLFRDAPLPEDLCEPAC